MRRSARRECVENRDIVKMGFELVCTNRVVNIYGFSDNKPHAQRVFHLCARIQSLGIPVYATPVQLHPSRFAGHSVSHQPAARSVALTTRPRVRDRPSSRHCISRIPTPVCPPQQHSASSASLVAEFVSGGSLSSSGGCGKPDKPDTIQPKQNTAKENSEHKLTNTPALQHHPTTQIGWSTAVNA